VSRLTLVMNSGHECNNVFANRILATHAGGFQNQLSSSSYSLRSPDLIASFHCCLLMPLLTRLTLIRGVYAESNITGQQWNHLWLKRDLICSVGPSIYEVKKLGFFPPCLHASTGATPPSSPLVDVHMCSTWNTHHSLETASTMTIWT